LGRYGERNFFLLFLTFPFKLFLAFPFLTLLFLSFLFLSFLTLLFLSFLFELGLAFLFLTFPFKLRLAFLFLTFPFKLRLTLLFLTFSFELCLAFPFSLLAFALVLCLTFTGLTVKIRPCERKVNRYSNRNAPSAFWFCKLHLSRSSDRGFPNLTITTTFCDCRINDIATLIHHNPDNCVTFFAIQDGWIFRRTPTNATHSPSSRTCPRTTWDTVS
jgi:hypothetical protein